MNWTPGRRARAAAILLLIPLAALHGSGAEELSFAPPIEQFVGGNPRNIATGDFNRDGRPDLAIVNGNMGFVSIVLGGSSLFGAARTIATPAASAIAVGDFNLDGSDDIAVASEMANGVMIFLSAGDGSFVSGSFVVTGNAPVDIAAADFDEDGRVDLAVVGKELRLLLSAGNGTFALPVSVPVAPYPLRGIAVADFNVDGHLDVATGISILTGAAVVLGTGTGSFRLGTLGVPTGTFVTSLAAGDFDEDGRPDLAASGVFPGTNPAAFGAVTLVTGIARFPTVTWQSVVVGPRGINVADFDGDGRLDVAVASSGAADIGYIPQATVFRGSGAGDLLSTVEIPLVGSPTGVAVSDITGDGRPDLFVTTGPAGTVAVLVNTNLLDYPHADAGPDQLVNEAASVTLDGSRSYDRQQLPLSYAWTQIAGPAVTLSGAESATPTFDAPIVPASGGTLVFRLSVANGMLTSGPDEVIVSVANVNQPPVADAGPDQTVTEGEVVSLSGSVFDPDGEQLVFYWGFLQWSPVSLSDYRSLAPTFVAPAVDRDGTTLQLALWVSDGLATTMDIVTIRVQNINESPAVEAGADQTVSEGQNFGFTASGTDPDGDPLTYVWTQIAGPSAALSVTDGLFVLGVAPAVPADGATLTFRVTVSDGSLSASDTVNLLVKNVNHAPIADAGADQSVKEGSPVTLDGSHSFDSDGETLSYQWTQTAGTAVSLSDGTAASPAFIAPQVPTGFSGELLTFRLTITDGIDTAVDTMDVLVEHVNHPPLADAGPDQIVAPGTLVVLDGRRSTDPDGDVLSYLWAQTAGTPVTLMLPDTKDVSTASFVAPSVTPGGDTVELELTVIDMHGVRSTDTVRVTVQHPTDPPACGLARPSIAVLWAPDHKLVPVGILGVSDPGNQVAITITAVTQNEPVDGLGDGDTGPDAIVQGSSVLLRAERAGHGNGRRYSIAFEATDSYGASCPGVVHVIVPLAMKPGVSVIDDGKGYDSTRGTR